MIGSIAFIATGRTLFPMIWGQPSGRPASPPQRLSSALPKLVFAAALVGLGVYIPPPVNALLERVAQAVEGL